MALPPEAKRGVQRAWLNVLHRRHPGVTWRIVEDDERGEPDNADHSVRVKPPPPDKPKTP